jgi:tRNA (guanine37-N1)-methyltransferase
MRFDIITLFPQMMQEVLGTSILKRAQESGHITVHLHDLRSYAMDKHNTVDDTPYGGGAGMVLRVDVMAACIRAVTAQVADIPPEQRITALLCPQGKVFDQRQAEQISSSYQQVTLICGHYEGFDERIRSLVTHELSIGNFVVTGGELPALVVIDVVSRFVPGVITEASHQEESHSIQDPKTGAYLLEYPHYTRPAVFEEQAVPEVLLSGNHAAIAAWRLDQARQRTTNAQ